MTCSVATIDDGEGEPDRVFLSYPDEHLFQEQLGDPGSYAAKDDVRNQPLLSPAVAEDTAGKLQPIGTNAAALFRVSILDKIVAAKSRSKERRLEKRGLVIKKRWDTILAEETRMPEDHVDLYRRAFDMIEQSPEDFPSVAYPHGFGNLLQTVSHLTLAARKMDRLRKRDGQVVRLSRRNIFDDVGNWFEDRYSDVKSGVEDIGKEVKQGVEAAVVKSE